MFKKKDLVNKADDGIPARFVKKDGIMRGNCSSLFKLKHCLFDLMLGVPMSTWP